MRYSDINIDFFVLTENKDLKTLSIYDNSHWQHLIDKTSVIDIKVPGSSKFVRNYFEKNAINNFNSVNLNINCYTSNCIDVELVDLPDGLYEIKVLSDGGYEEERGYFRTNILEREFDKYIMSQNFDCDLDECKIKESMHFLFYLKAIESYTRNCDFNKAQKFYEMARKLIGKNSKNKCKTC